MKNILNEARQAETTKKIEIGYVRTCECPRTHINCLTAKGIISNNDEAQTEEREYCLICGRSVELGSGRFVNRVSDGNDILTRIELGRQYPLNDYICYECDQMECDVES